MISINNKISVLTVFLICLHTMSSIAQTNWNSYLNMQLKLVKYGIYSNGREVNVITPSAATHNEGEYICLRSDGTLIWGNNGNGTETFPYQVSGEYCHLNRKPKSSWLKIIQKSNNLLFTVDNLGTYRYFQIPTLTTGMEVIDFIFPCYINSNNGKIDENPTVPEGLKEYIIRFELQSTQIVLKVMEIDRCDDDRTNLLETHYINPRTSILEISDDTFRVTEPNKYKGFTFIPKSSAITMNDKWASDGKSLRGRCFVPPTDLAQAAIDGMNKNKNFKHTRFGETDFNGKFARLKARFLQYHWLKISR